MDSKPAPLPVSRQLTGTPGQNLTVSFPGDGWIFLGTPDGSDAVHFVNKRVSDGQSHFVFRISRPGDYTLMFQRQNLTTGEQESQNIAMVIKPATPDYGGKVPRGTAVGGGPPAAIAAAGNSGTSSSAPSAAGQGANSAATAVSQPSPQTAGAGGPTTASPSTQQASASTASSVPTKAGTGTSGTTADTAISSGAAKTPTASSGTTSGQNPGATSVNAATGSTQAASASAGAGAGTAPAGSSGAGTPGTTASGSSGGAGGAAASSPTSPPEPAPSFDLSTASGLLGAAKYDIEKNQGKEAEKVLLEYISKYGVDGNADEAYFLLGKLYEDNSQVRNIRSSLKYYSELRKQFPFSKYWEDAGNRIRYINQHFIYVR